FKTSRLLRLDNSLEFLGIRPCDRDFNRLVPFTPNLMAILGIRIDASGRGGIPASNHCKAISRYLPVDVRELTIAVDATQRSYNGFDRAEEIRIAAWTVRTENHTR